MKAELRRINGAMEVFVNGERQSRMWGRLALPAQNAPEKIEQYMEAGIDAYLTTIDLDCNIGWNGDDTYEYRPYEVHLDRILAVKPDIKLVLFVGYSASAPYRWCRKNEDHLVLLSNGDRLRIGSFASDKWLEDSNRAMAAFVKHFQSSRFAENIIGFNPIMYSNEWHTPSSRGHPPLDDYSEPMVRHFREWLRRKYDDDENALRGSWRVDGLTFDQAQIPPETRRLRTGMKPLAFGERDVWVSDYEACLQQARDNFAIETCRTIKESAQGPVLTCLSRREGSLAMLNCDWVDVLHGPYGYQNRKLGHVYGYSRQNLALHDKLGMYQIDTGTHVMPKTGGDPLGITGVWPGPHRLADSEWESLELLERDVCRAVADRRHVYWNDGGPGWMFPVVSNGILTYGRHWFDTPAIKELIVKCKNLVDRQALSGARSGARVALVGCDYGQPCGAMSNTQSAVVNALFNLPRTEMALQRSGVVYETVTLEDFASIEQQYGVYVFPNAFHVTGLLRERIHAKLVSDRATAVWLYAPGYVDETGFGIERIQALTGLALQVEHTETVVHTEKPNAATRLLRGVPAFGSRAVAKSYSSDMPLENWAPEYESVTVPAVFHCVDPEAEALALFQGNGRAAIAVGKRHGFDSIWIGAPEVPWQLWRNLCAAAGVHIYSETGDYLMANERFAALYCITGGRKCIKLPSACRVTDALEETMLYQKADEIRFDAKAGENRCFALEPLG